MLLNILQCPGQPPSKKNYLHQNVSSTRVEEPWTKIIFFSCFLKNFYFEIIGDSHAVGRNTTERSNVPFTQFLPVVTSCTTIVQYHKLDIDTDNQDAEYFYPFKGPSPRPFVATFTSFAHPLALIFYETPAISLLLQKLPNSNCRVILFLSIIPSYQECCFKSRLNLTCIY